MSFCQVKRNNKGVISKVLDSNGRESAVFYQIYNDLQNIDIKKSTVYNSLLSQGFIKTFQEEYYDQLEQALALWSKLYSNDFKAKYGDPSGYSYEQLRDYIFDLNQNDVGEIITRTGSTSFSHLSEAVSVKDIIKNIAPFKIAHILYNGIKNYPIIKAVRKDYGKSVSLQGNELMLSFPQIHTNPEASNNLILKGLLQYELKKALEEYEYDGSNAEFNQAIKGIIKNTKIEIEDSNSSFIDILLDNTDNISLLIEEGLYDTFEDAVAKYLSWPKGVPRSFLSNILLSGTKEQYVKPQEKLVETTPTIIDISYSGIGTIDMLKDDVTINNLKLVDTDPADTHYSYIGGRLHRLTDFINKTFLIGKDKDMALARAEIIFKNNNQEQATGKVMHDGKEYDFDKLVALFREEANIASTFGKIGHLYMQKWFTEDKAIQGRIETEITDLMSKLPGKNASKYFSFLKSKDTIRRILAAFSIRKAGLTDDIDPADEDKVFSEFLIMDKDLNIGSTGDLLVVYKDGEVSLIDWKTGAKFYNNLFIQNIIQYSNKPAHKVNVAKLELALRAFMLQKKNLEKNGKFLRFKHISVAHLHEEYEVNPHEVEMSEYLEIIEAWLSKSKPSLHADLQKKGLFKSSNYGGRSGSLSEHNKKMKNKTREEKIAYLKNEITKKTLEKPEHRRTEKDKKYITKLYKMIAELENIESAALEDNVDLGWFKKNFGNWYSVTSTRLQNFGKMVMGAKSKVRREVQEIEKQHDKLLSKVYEEYSGSPMYKLTKGYLGNLNYRDFYAFMWEEKTTADSTGFFMNTKDTYTDINGNTKSMTKAQIAYRDFVKSTMGNLWSEVMGQVAFNNKIGNPVTKAKAAGYSDKLKDDFMPRVPAEASEFILEGKSKDKASYLAYKAMASFLEKFNTRNKNQFSGAIPVKYMGSFVITSEQLHTFSAEVAFKQFVTNMVNKKHMDSMAAISDGLKSYYQAKQNSPGEGNWDNTLEFIEDHLLLDILDVKREMNLTRNPPRIPRNKYTTELGLADRPVALDSIVLGFKSAITAGAMWLKLVPASFNAALIFMLNFKKALEGSIGKMRGLDDREIEYTLGDFIDGMRVWAQAQSNSLVHNEEGAKLLKMAEHLNYLPENYDYKAHPDSMFAPKNRLNLGMLFVFHKIGEDMGNYTILYATLKRMKTVDKQGKEISMWDAYKYDSAANSVYYDGGVRGSVERADGSYQELSEITEEELIRLKRVSQKIHGGYRQEERVAMELTALGSVVMQFRKFLPVIMENAFQGRYVDNSLGFYAMKKDENGNYVLKDGKNVYEWQRRVSEGRILILMKLITSYFKLGDTSLFGTDNYSWDKLTNEDKQNVIEIMLTAGMILFWLGIRGSAIDDDDEDKALFVRLDRLFLEDITQGYNPLDIFRSIQTQGALFYQGFDFLQAFSDFMLKGVIQGKTTQDGNIPGVNKMLRRIPPFSSIKDLEKYFGKNKTGIGFWDFDNL